MSNVSANRKRQNYGIKFPFSNEQDEKRFVDLDKDEMGYVRSQIYHVVFTPKGQRLRRPDFGTDLIRYIFEPNDAQEWSEVESEIRDSVSKYVRGATIGKIEVYKPEEDGRSTVVSIRFTVKRNGREYSDRIITEI